MIKELKIPKEIKTTDNKVTNFVESSYKGSDPLVSMLANASFNRIFNNVNIEEA